ncbi:hypothetical protein JW905_08995 [bacterium]|nr:hypothetical protein [candidate division CSSED10-310 bacterium]
MIAGRRNNHGHGHVVFLIEGCEDAAESGELCCFNVGLGIPKKCSLSTAFGSLNGIKFLTPKQTYEAWTNS